MDGVSAWRCVPRYLLMQSIHVSGDLRKEKGLM